MTELMLLLFLLLLIVAAVTRRFLSVWLLYWMLMLLLVSVGSEFVRLAAMGIAVEVGALCLQSVKSELETTLLMVLLLWLLL